MATGIECVEKRRRTRARGMPAASVSAIAATSPLAIGSMKPGWSK
jgi:hypothetical protein